MEAKAIPKWLTKRYSVLWKKFKEKEFGFDGVVKALKEKDERMVSITLSRLKKNGWLEVEIHPNNSRKRVYKLKTPEKAMEEISSSK